MKKILPVLIILFLTVTPALTQILGTPGKAGQLKLKLGEENISVLIDGIDLIPAEDNTISMDFSHGPHLVKIHKLKDGLEGKLLLETVLYIPGEYQIEATYTKAGLLISSSTPIGGTTSGSSTTDVQTSGTTGTSKAGSTTTSQTAANSKLSQLVFMSKTGKCEVYLDGIIIAELGLPKKKEMAIKTVRDIEPGNHQVKIAAINDTWYEGYIVVKPNQELKIQIEPGNLEIISRNALK